MTQQLEQNLATAQKYLARFRDNTLGHFIKI